MHSQLFEILMGSLLTPSAACSVPSTAATTGSAAERPLLGSGATLGAALPVLPRLSPAAHITKGATRTLRACDPLAAYTACDPLAAYTAWASNASRTAW